MGKNVNQQGNVVIVVLVLMVGGTIVFALTGALKGQSIGQFFTVPKQDFTPQATPRVSVDRSQVRVQTPSIPRRLSDDAIPQSTIVSPTRTVTPPHGFTVDQLSPWYDMVRVGSVRRTNQVGGRESFTLTAQSSVGDGVIAITGWYIEANRGRRLTIPTAISDYNPGFSYAGPVVLGRGDKMVAYSNKSAFGRNIRLNKCVGYLNNVYSFNPPFPSRCPKVVNRDEISSFVGACQSLLLSVRGCQELLPSDLAAFANRDRQCVDYAHDRFGYGPCYRRHHTDADFLSSEWYVWMDREFPFDFNHDRVVLYDQNGLLVDEYVY
jgi:hypothetical protein